MKKIFLLLLFKCLASTFVSAQICCQTSVTTGTTVTYSYTPGGFLMSPYWQLNNNSAYGSMGTPYLVGSQYRVDITWHTAGSETLAFLDNFNFLASIDITITQALPLAPVANPATSITPISFNANWSSVASATNYRLDVATNNTFTNFVTDYNNRSVTGGNVQSVIGLTAGTTYYYRVRSQNVAGYSGYSSTITAITLPVIPDYNYVKTISVQKEGLTTQTQIDNATIGDKLVSTNFFDGLGRLMQTVNMKGSPAMLDVVQPVVYDIYGREAKKYLPFTANNDGNYKPNVGIIDAVTGNYIGIAQPFYATASSKVAVDIRPYSETIFETSPLDRILEQSGPGDAWKPDLINGYNSTDRTVKKVYETNAASEVLLWTFTYPTQEYSTSATNAFGKIEAGTAAAPIYYSANQLRRDRTKDEHNNEVIEYTDKNGRVVLKRVQIVSGATVINDTNYASTYYIYDDFGNLVCVIPPEAVVRITQTNPVSEYFGMTDAVKNNFLKRWAFRYRYDALKRMVLKQVPGAEPVYMVYDIRDRLIVTQDGLQRSVSPYKWTFTKYDELNRPIMTGIKDTTVLLTQTQMQSAVNTHFAKTASRWSETFVGNVAGNFHGYSNKAYPVRTTGSTADANSYLTVMYYDNYDFRSLWVGVYTYLNESLSEVANGITYTQPTTENARVVGQVTGTKMKVLDGGTSGGYTWLKSLNYYDDKYRVIQSLADNYKGGTDRITSVIDFTGKVLESKSTHTEADVTWKDLVGVTQRGNILVRTTGTAGAASVQSLPAGVNGWLEFVVSEVNTTRYVGFNDTNPDATPTNINYAFKLTNTTLTVVENNGTAKATVNNIVPGDVLRIERIGTIIKYYRNGVEITATAPTASSTLLMVDVSTASANATFVGVRSSFSSNTRVTNRRFEYDHAGRLLKTWHKLDANAEILLAYNEYNELGQLVDKKVHSTVSNASDAKQSVDYRYNIRGWLTKMNESNVSALAPGDVVKDYFGFELAYNNTSLGIGNTPQYNGNISAMAWSNNQSLGTSKQNGFVYSYDPMSRLTIGTHKLSATGR